MDLRSNHDTAIAAALAGRHEMAADILRDALRQAPNDAGAARSLGIVLLTLGRYAEGAPLYEARLAAEPPRNAPQLPFPRWAGEPLDGKTVLIWPEQGAGDQIMFARFAAVLASRGCDVTLICHPTLERLFRQSLPVRVLGASGAVEFPDPDVWLWSNSLLAAAGADLASLPAAPYLFAAPARAPSFRIGVATRGNPNHPNDAHRSLPEREAAVLLGLPGAGSLHAEDTGAADFAETAEIIAGLDLVISVDTSIAHLAGAMGKPVWVLLPEHQTDWRWMRDRPDSPWYPSARLFRQPLTGDWASVLDAVTEAARTGDPGRRRQP
jgi:hypothetical protein